MAVPPPSELNSEALGEARGVYRDELRAKLRIVLEKALRGHEHNLELFERLGVETEWVTKSRVAIERLRSLLSPGASVDVANPARPPADAVPQTEPGAAPAPTLENAAPVRRAPPEAPAPTRQVL
jgi:hypothetical protein